MANWKTFVRKYLLSILIAISVSFGLGFGLLLKSLGTRWSSRDAMYLMFPGEVFLRILKVLIVPVLITSIISALAALNLGVFRKIAFWTTLYYTITTLNAAFLALILVLIMKPGVGSSVQMTDDIIGQSPKMSMLTPDIYLDAVRNIFPPNLVQACLEWSRTILTKSADNPEESYVPMMNILGLSLFSVAFGITLSHMGEKGKIIVNIINNLNNALLNITRWLIWISPVGIFFIITGNVVAVTEYSPLLIKPGSYLTAVFLGLILHAFGVVAAIYFIAARKLHYKMLMKLGRVLTIAFATASSAATMSFTINTLVEVGLDPRIVKFVIPAGAAVNVSGTALYDVVAVFFIINLRGISINFGQMLLMCLTTIVGNIGIAGLPQTNLITMMVILDAVGVPPEDVIVILGFDWLLVFVDCMGASLVHKLSASKLDLEAANEGGENADGIEDDQL